MTDHLRAAKDKVQERALAAAGAEAEEKGYAVVSGESADQVARKLLYGYTDDPDVMDEILEATAQATECAYDAAALVVEAGGGTNHILQTIMLIMVQQFMLGYEVGKNAS